MCVLVLRVPDVTYINGNLSSTWGCVDVIVSMAFYKTAVTPVR